MVVILIASQVVDVITLEQYDEEHAHTIGEGNDGAPISSPSLF
jgi:hypothetical protein